jgi:hypothetical protein
MYNNNILYKDYYLLNIKMTNQINLQKIITTGLLLSATNFINEYIVFLLFIISCINTDFSLSKIEIMLYLLINMTYGLNFTVNFIFLKNMLNYMNIVYFMAHKYCSKNIGTNNWYLNLKYYIDKSLDILIYNKYITNSITYIVEKFYPIPNVKEIDNQKDDDVKEELLDNVKKVDFEDSNESEYDPELDEDFNKIHNNLSMDNLSNLPDDEEERKKIIMAKFTESMKIFGNLCAKIAEKNK